MTAPTSDDLRTMFDTNYIGAWSLRGRDVTVTITKILAGSDIGQQKSRKPLAFFKGWPKPLIINKTMLETIKNVHGTLSAAALVGKRVTLFATTCQGKAGGIVDCVRIRPVVPTSPGVSEDDVGRVPADPEMRRRQMEQAGDLPPEEPQ